jgi:hypothetical protein
MIHRLDLVTPVAMQKRVVAVVRSCCKISTIGVNGVGMYGALKYHPQYHTRSHFILNDVSESVR